MRGVFVLVELRWDQFSPQSTAGANSNTRVRRLTNSPTNGLMRLLEGSGMCVGVVKEKRGLKLISLIPHILNMQGSGPVGDKKRENMLLQNRKKEATRTCSCIYPTVIEYKV